MVKKNKQEMSSQNQESLFKPLTEWLEFKGYYSLVTHNRKEVGIWIGDLFPSKTYIEPDVVGVRSSWTDTICVEVEVKPDEIFEIIGKCMVWKLIASRVYLSYPKQKGFKTSGFEKLNIGLLEVSDNQVKEIFTPRSEGLWDTSKSQELFNQVWNVIRSQPRESRIQITGVNAYKYEDKWSVTIQFRNTGSTEVMLTELLINERPCEEISNIRMTSKFPTKEKPLMIEPFREDSIYMEIRRSDLFNSGVQVEFSLQTENKGEDSKKIKLP